MASGQWLAPPLRTVMELRLLGGGGLEDSNDKNRSDSDAVTAQLLRARLLAAWRFSLGLWASPLGQGCWPPASLKQGHSDPLTMAHRCFPPTSADTVLVWLIEPDVSCPVWTGDPRGRSRTVLL